MKTKLFKCKEPVHNETNCINKNFVYCCNELMNNKNNKTNNYSYPISYSPAYSLCGIFCKSLI